MATLSLAGREPIVLPAYKLGAIRKAAPVIQSLNARMAAAAGATPTVADMVDLLGDFIAFLAVGTVKVDPALTAEALEDLIGLDDLPAVQVAFREVLAEAGFRQGEAKAPVAEATGASQTS